MKHLIIFHLFSILASCTAGQGNEEFNPQLVGSCEGCEAVFEYGDRALGPVDTLPDFNDIGIRIKVTGRVYEPDGTTPAKDVILYVFHTNQEGIYESRSGARNWERRHGYIRGWLETGEDGRYTFYTMKPGAYPDRSEPAHIHIIVLEPDGKYYWIEGFLFEDDPMVTPAMRSSLSERGGSDGVVSLQKQGDLFVAERDIILAGTSRVMNSEFYDYIYLQLIIAIEIFNPLRIKIHVEDCPFPAACHSCDSLSCV